MGTSSVDWSDQPPDHQMRYIPIYSPRPGQVMRLIILSDEVVGAWTHWLDERTIPCRGRDQGCVCRKMDLSRRWKGYLGCFDPEIGKVVIAELTLSAYHCLADSLSEIGHSLRGRGLILMRAGKSVRSSVVADTNVNVPTPEGFVLPSAPNVREALRRIWGV